MRRKPLYLQAFSSIKFGEPLRFAKLRFAMLLTLFLLFALGAKAQQTTLLGTNPRGGIQFGTIFSYKTGNTFLDSVYKLQGIPGSQPQYPSLTQTNNGRLLGVTRFGGIYNSGVIFEYNDTTNNYSKKIDLNAANGSHPIGTLLLASNGKYYGMTYDGGVNNMGVIYEYDYSTNVYTKKIDLASANGSHPYGSLIQANNGKLYGMTYDGGGNNVGVVFEYDYTTNTYTKKIDLSSANGSNPYGALLQASNGRLYGLTQSGGANNAGVIFEYNDTSNTYTIKYSFIGSTGSKPYASLIQASNGKLYGTTLLGGLYGYGVIFVFDYTASNYSDLYDFFNSTNGYGSTGSLLQTSTGKLYGLTQNGGIGGTGSDGVIFEYNYLTSTYTKKFDLGSISATNSSGALMQANNGKLYGLSNIGGIQGSGIIFEYDLNSATCTKKIDLSLNQGYYPTASLTKAINGKLYGVAAEGGLYGRGVIFEYNYPANTYTKKIDLGGVGFSNGANPQGSMLQASNGKFYGLTLFGGTNSSGVIYEYNDTSNTYSVKVNLNHNTNLGSDAIGSLIQANNGKLYGMTESGGTYGNGALIEYDFTNNIGAAKFDGINASEKGAVTLIEATNGKLYWMNQVGISEYNYITNIYTLKVTFSSLTGDGGVGSLIKATNGKLYGMTNGGGTHNLGVIFEYDYNTNVYSKKFDFDSINGSHPLGSLIQASNGKLYGVTSSGGSNNVGVLFEYDYVNNSVIKKIDFDMPYTGGNPSYLMEYNPCITSTIPIISATTTNICGLGGSSTLSIYSGVLGAARNWFWYKDSCGGIPIDSGLTITVSPSTVTTYYVRGESSCKLFGNTNSRSVTINVYHPTSNTIIQTLCTNSSYTFNNKTLTSGGVYYDTMVNYLGCDSIITLNLTINSSITNVNNTVCGSYTFHNQTITHSGTYHDTLTNYHGCDSFITLHLTIIPTSQTTYSKSISAGQSYLFNGHSLTTAGTYYDTLTNYLGCDSFITLHLIQQACPAMWSEVGGLSALAANNYIWRICTDGSNNLYTAGRFTNSNGKQYVAKWDGSAWTELGGNNSLAANNEIYNVFSDAAGNVYASGIFTNSSGNEYIAKWNGSSWSELGGNNSLAANSEIYTMCRDAAGNIYAAGWFTNANGNAYVAKWNGTTWSELGGNNSLAANSSIWGICADAAGNIYATGNFTNASGKRYVAKWNGTTWSELGGTNALAANDVIRCISVDAANHIYVAGRFTNANGKEYVAKYNGSTWAELGGTNALAANGDIYSVHCDGSGNIYCSGDFTNGNLKWYVAKYNGSTWAELGGNNALAANWKVETICHDGSGNIYAACAFTNSVGKYYVAEFDNCQMSFSQINQSICPNSSYTFNNQALTAAGTYYDTLINYHGADSIVTLHLSIKPLYHGITYQTITPWGNYTWHNQSYGYPMVGSGNYIYVDTFKSYLGCDSLIDSLNLTVANCTQINAVGQLVIGSSSNICTGYSYLPFMTDGYVNVNGSLNSWSGTVQGNTSLGGTSPLYPFGNNNYTPVYVDTSWISVTITYSYSYYCQSLLVQVQTNQITEPVYKTPILPALASTTVCAGKGVVLGAALSNSYTYSWTPTGTLINNLTKSPTASPAINTTYTVVATGSGGCNASATQVVNVLTNSSAIQSAAVCAPYSFHHHQLMNSGTYYDSLINYVGCDSFVTLHLSIKPISNSSITTSICANQTYTLPKGKTVNTAGIYKDTLTNYLGCDSIISTHLSVIRTSQYSYAKTICGYQTYVFHSQALNSSGNYYDTLTNYIGCDSLITLNLTVLPDSVQLNGVFCNNATYNFNGVVLNTAGIYRDTLQNQLGCDSIVVLHLYSHATSFKTITTSICSNQSYTVGIHTYSTAGNYQDTLTNYVGCDSVITLQLSVRHTSSSSQSASICSNQYYLFHNHLLNNNGVYQDTVLNYVGCDSIISLHLSVKPISSSSFSQTICANHPYTFNGHALNASGIYYDTLTNYLGCDSILTLHLNVKQVSHKTISSSICSNHTYLFNGHALNTAGTYYDTLTNYVGCDSFITLYLSIKPVSNKTINQTICANHPYTFNGHALSSSGTYRDTLVNHFGCDSFITLHLTVKPISTANVNNTICKNNPYYFNQHWLDSSGLYKDTLVNYAGCDSFISLQLVVKPISITNSQSSICGNQTYSFHHQLLNHSGVYHDTLQNYLGCDSTVILHLQVNISSSSNVTESVCSNRPYHFNHLYLDSSGIFHDTIPNYSGCDSTITLNLTMYPEHPRVTNVLGKLTAFGSGYDHLYWMNCYTKSFVSSANPYDVNESGNYAVVVTQGNCSDTSACINVDISCYLEATPNPAKDEMTIKIKCGDKAFHVLLTDVLGRTLMYDEIENVGQFTLYRNRLPSGIYFLYLSNKHFVEMVKKVMWE